MKLLRYKTDGGLFEPLCLICLNCHLMAKLEYLLVYMLLLILQAQVCSCISPHPGFPHQKTKQETCDA